MGLVLALAALPMKSLAVSQSHSEEEVKAAFIYNFTKFIDWPVQADQKDRLIIGYWGNGNMMNALKALDGRKTGQKIIVVKNISHPCELDGINVLVIEGRKFFDRKILDRLVKRNVLTISQGLEAVSRGIIIGLFKEENRIRFAVNLKVAKESRLTISSRLLSLAKKVIQ